ncbi:MAG: hypothetical protein P9C48_12475 [Defluviicoccus sp.]|nr:hypothetical protein [Defluviicoccus sp.]MDG4609935.1 hypothetical protein [Defluviicoccus sp.]
MRKHKPFSPYIRAAIFVLVGAVLGYLIAYISGANPSIVPLLSAGIGLFIAFAIPIWQALFFNAPKLEVEISSIKRSVSEGATISLDDHAELSVLKPDRDSSPFFPWVLEDDGNPRIIRSTGSTSSGQKLTTVDALLERAKQQLKDLPEQINERRRDIERLQSLTVSTFTRFECEQFNRPLPDEVEFDPEDKEGTLNALRDRYHKRLERLEKRYAELQGSLPVAERKLELLKAELVDSRSFFTVSASLINSGRTNTAIKVPALFRVSIGEGNYIDIKLSLKDFENKSEISANGTRIVLFESPEISGFPEEDRRLINTYWGQSVSARLYLEDIHARAYGSNRIAFAEGLYQKIIYDRLARVASSDHVSKSAG